MRLVRFAQAATLVFFETGHKEPSRGLSENSIPSSDGISFRAKFAENTHLFAGHDTEHFTAFHPATILLLIFSFPSAYLHEVSVLEADGDKDNLAVDRELSIVGVRVVHVFARRTAGGPRRAVNAHCTLNAAAEIGHRRMCRSGRDCSNNTPTAL